MNPFDFFDAIFCISPEHNESGLKEAQREFGKLRILHRVEILNATEIDRRFLGTETPTGRMRYKATALCHLEIIKRAKDRGLNNVLIFEDDVKFLSNWNPCCLSDAVDAISQEEWKLFYLGYNVIQHGLKFERLSENLIMFPAGSDLRSTHAYSISKLAYDMILDEFNPDAGIIDIWLTQNIGFHCLYPLMSVQDQVVNGRNKIDIFKENFVRMCNEQEPTRASLLGIVRRVRSTAEAVVDLLTRRGRAPR